ncbi:MAG TPA: methylmalonyl Co-A mutase-associated GTPase MeaB [Candidatus Krumholzibacteria bacterium]|nr:methylmalonyl Co-A mutase-associated GTPase MeaB [Candidatus Krumholzibacteria bacterium]
MAHDIHDLLARFATGDTLAASRLMTVVEQGGAGAEAVLDALFARTGRARRIAFTGPGGAGKSTLVDAMTGRLRAAGRTVGVVAEDPTSPFSGGAVLGDRVRMGHAAGDPGVFVRSLASRGSETGISLVACELADVLDAFGRDVVLLETMGVGQVETRIRFAADSVVVVLTPESGDEVQSLKAGLLEVADMFVVNKSDRPGAEAFAADLEAVAGLRPAASAWIPPVVQTVASEETGLAELEAALERHRAHMAADGRGERRRREGLAERVRALVEAAWRDAWWQDPTARAEFDGMVERVANGGMSPYGAAREIARRLTSR